MNGTLLVNGAAAAPSTTAQAAVFVASEDIANEAVKIGGPDFNEAHTLDALLQSYATIGFQASGLTRAIEIVEKMVSRDTPSLLRRVCAVAELALKNLPPLPFGWHPTCTLVSPPLHVLSYWHDALLEEMEAVR